MKVYYTNQSHLQTRGILSIVVGILVIVLPEATLTLVALLFAALLLINGASLIYAGLRAGPAGRWVVMTIGGVAAFLGLATVVWPDVTITVLAMLLAVWAVLNGFWELSTAIRFRHSLSGAFYLGLVGAVSLAFGLVLFFYPLEGARALAIVLGAYAVVTGILFVLTGLRLGRTSG